ncbi:MAG TPA: DUF4142 domain-containing protein [Terriglobia bacterium]|nr:DUF4142 domain-containing protein [Terriglobia bacterium]
MKGISAAAIILALVAPAAFARQHQAKEAGKVSMTDQQFVDFAAQTDMTEANLGQAAQDKGGQAAKDYGQLLRSDHTSDYTQLSDAAKKAGLTVPTAIDAAHNRMIDALNKLKGTAFDRQFAREMVTGHEHAVAVYRKEAQDAQSPDLKTYARQAVVTLEGHLSNARQLEKSKG